MKNNMREAGITLIALVVTIIVLLILASITIGLVLGQNGLLQRAQIASNTMANATANELAQMGQYASDVESLTSGFIDNGGSSGSGSGESNITIKESDGTIINLANIADYYGREVTYKGEIYQLFYVDTEGKYSNEEPRIWLQHKEYESGVQLSAHYETTGLTDTDSIMYQINPDWKRLIGDDLVGKTDEQLNVNAYRNYRGVAYLCNPQNWNATYLAEGDEEKGAFAIGGVSAEMWCDSYNEARGKISTDADYFSAKAYSENSTKGYRYKPGHANASTNEEGYGYYTDNTNYAITTDYRTMYRISNTSFYGPWLASPSSAYDSGVSLVWGDTACLGNSSATSTLKVRAAVSLPSSIQIKLNN